MSKILGSLPTFLLFMILSSQLSASPLGNNDEAKSLLTLKNSFPPNAFPQWDTKANHCDLDFIKCNFHGDITSIAISSSQYPNIRGTIPSSIGDFPNLTFLSLSFLPNLVGPIPRSITKLKNLQYLIIANTNVSGPIPPFLSELPSLVYLALSQNKLSGPIPASLGQLENLTTIDFTSNQLTGTIPPTLFQKASEKQFYVINFLLPNNKIIGEIPKTFGKILFSRLDLSGNRLEGDASFLLHRSKQGLTLLALGHNRLSFDLTNVEYPEGSLYYLNISHNEIYGSISKQITQVALETFDVSYNRLCGEIPSGGKFGPFDKQFFLHNKCLCGTPLPLCK